MFILIQGFWYLTPETRYPMPRHYNSAPSSGTVINFRRSTPAHVFNHGAYRAGQYRYVTYVPFRSRRIYDLNWSNPVERRRSLMRKYELVCIVQPELDETAFKGVIDR